MSKKICFYILIVLSLFSITGCKKINEKGIENGTYKYIDENNKESKIIIKNDKLIFEDIDFTETYETLALVSLSLEYTSKLNEIGQADMNSLLEEKTYNMSKNKNYKLNTEYDYTYNEENQVISLQNEVLGIMINYKTNEKEKPYLELYSKTFKK